MINITDLTVRYKEEVAIDRVNLSIEKGKSYAIIGESGCGKTTLLFTMAGLVSNYEGKLEIEGNTSLILQNLGLFNWFTVEKNIELGLNNIKMAKEEKKELVDRILKELGLYQYKNKYPKSLSGGQKQRVAIGRTLISNPEILLLDEATSALDNTTEYYIKKSLDELAKGRTTIVVAHRLSTIRNADEIIVLTDKGIEERGTHEELMNIEGVYKELNKFVHN